MTVNQRWHRLGWAGVGWPFKVMGAIAGLSLGGVGMSSLPAIAQVTFDGSLGTAPLTAPAYVIPQAAGRTAGANLFHSFRQFNIAPGESVTFESDAVIRNILARVTGGRSSIEGLLATQSRAVNLFLINSSGIVFGQGARLDVGGSFVATTGTGGIAGDLQIRTGQLRVDNGARVTVSGAQGQAGNLTVAASRIRLDRGELTAETGADRANQANIQLRELDLLVLRHGSQISARAFNQGDGGNVEIEASGGYVIGVPNENSDIIANAEGGNGGNINITTQSIIGLVQTNSTDPRNNPISEINASSQFGLNGNIVINTPGIEPGQGLLELPAEVVDASRLIAQGCAAGDAAVAAQSEFVMTGRGGLPPNPEQPLQQDAVIADWVTAHVGQTRAAIAEPLVSRVDNVDEPTLVEAQGWTVGSDGQVMLTTQAPRVVSATSGLPGVQCPAL